MPTYIPACLPVCDMFIYTYVRPTSGGRIEAVFSRNAGYHHATTDLLIQWRFIHCAIVSPFILHCFSSSLTGELKNCQWIVMAYIYTCYVMLMAKMYMYMIAWSIKIINKHNVFAMCRFKSAWMVSCCNLYVSSWDVISQYSCCQNRYIYHMHTTIIYSLLTVHYIIIPKFRQQTSNL